MSLDNKLLKISQVAKQFNISRPTLLHYDHIDLLKPSYRNDKNYRFYTHQDISRLEFILALKESGLTIKEIKTYLEGESKGSSIDILVDQQEKITQKIHALEKQQTIIGKRIEQLKLFDTLDLYKGVLIDHYPALKIAVEPIGYGPLMSYESAKHKLHARLNNKERLSSKFSIWFKLSQSSPPRVKMQYVCDQNVSNASNDKVITYPESDYIRCLHYGSYHTIEESIGTLLNFAKTHHYEIIGDVFFIPLFDYWELQSEEDFVNEVLMPVKIK